MKINPSINVDPNKEDLFDCYSMYALISLGFDYKDSDKEHRVLRKVTNQLPRRVTLSFGQFVRKYQMVALTSEDDIYGVTRVCKSFNINWMYILSFKEPSFIYTLVNFNFPTEKEFVIGTLDARHYTQQPSGNCWVRGEENMNFYNINLLS